MSWQPSAVRPNCPTRAVVITVDDAYLSVYEVAYPRLKARGYPFTIFVATDTVDAGRGTYMTWSQMRAMAEGGATFANHGSSHRSYVEWPGVVSEIDRLARVRADIEHAERRLAEELQPLPGILAYPYGEYDTSAAELVKTSVMSPLVSNPAPSAKPVIRAPCPGFRWRRSTQISRTSPSKWRLAPSRWRRYNRGTRSPRPFGPASRSPSRTPTPTSNAWPVLSAARAQVAVEWIEPGRRFAVSPKTDLQPGRNRVNCTAPTADGGAFHWYSHPWIVRQGQQ